MKKLLGCLLASGAMCCAQLSLETEFRTTGSAVLAAFEAQRSVLQSSSAVIMDGRSEALYAVLVSRDGHLLTKASDFGELKKPEVILGKTRHREVRVLGRDDIWDVILLKIDAHETVPVVYAKEEPKHGTWVVVNGATSRFRRRALAGIISANAREIPVAGGVALGVTLDGKEGLPVVRAVQEGSGAEAAGIRQGDVIVKLAGVEVAGMEQIRETVKDRKAGERVEVVVRRGGREINLQVRLGSKTEMFRQEELMDRNDGMSGRFSRRRSGFPRVIQHDILANNETVGGPVLNLDGECVGMNIARVNRAETFGIPAKELREIAERLMAASGK